MLSGGFYFLVVEIKMEKKLFTAIVARRVSDGAIGFNGSIPWDIPEDMVHFRNLTSETHLANPLPVQFNICVMGRKTFESLPKGYLPGRRVFVLSSRDSSSFLSNPLVEFFSSQDALLEVIQDSPCSRVFICGGQDVYELFMDLCDSVVVTEVFQRSGPADTFFPTHYLDCDFEPVSKDDGLNIRFSSSRGTPFRHVVYRRKHPENVYLDIGHQIVCSGRLKGDRTGIGVYSIFGPQMEFDLRRGFPLLTTKKVFWAGVLQELFWFISGSTDSKLLSREGVRIWEGNTSREFLDSRGLPWEEGDIGPGYGFQWKHWGAEYKGCRESYEGMGVDQLKGVISDIRTNPESRRLVVSAWNVSELDRMALPPCHLLFQFYVEDQFLDLKMYQRSGDWFLGVPFNIASYGILLMVVAHLTGKRARKLVMTYGDAHVYTNHVQQMTEQLSRKPLTLPEVRILDRGQTCLEDYLPGDVLLHNYRSHPPIRASMAV